MPEGCKQCPKAANSMATSRLGSPWLESGGQVLSVNGSINSAHLV